MRLTLVLAVALAACAPGPAAAPSPSAPVPTPATSPTQAPTPTPNMSAAVKVGAAIALDRIPLSPGAPTDRQQDGGVFLEAQARGEWMSDWREPGFSFTRLVPSWNASVPDGTSITIEAQARRTSGGETKWFSFGKWAFGDEVLKRTSADGQRDADGRVETDTLVATGRLSAYRVRVTLEKDLARVGTGMAPVLRGVSVVVSDDAAVRSAPASAHTGVVKDIAVPPLSQMIHRGEYPQYGSGGEAWCSPTSTLMVLKHWGRGPTKADVGWVDPRYADPEVDHAARFTYDSEYGGTGNWSFNVAYAAQYGVNAFVTQLRSLAEAERFIAAGIPLVASVKIAAGALPGFLLPEGSNGHLLVIRGFTETGDVISNDPAANSNAEVRRVYPRAAFEKTWMGGSGGTVYVIHPPEVALPPRVDGASANW